MDQEILDSVTAPAAVSDSTVTPASGGEPAAEPRVRACVFMLAGEPFAVGIEATREIVTIEDCTPVPLAPPTVLGVINLRGTLVPLIDVRPILGLTVARGRPALALLLATASVQFAIVIDAVVGLAALADLPALRETVRRRFGDCAVGVAKAHETQPTLLDVEALAQRLMPGRAARRAMA
jgi:chemotaxis signal transduction protein